VSHKRLKHGAPLSGGEHSIPNASKLTNKIGRYPFIINGLPELLLATNLLLTFRGLVNTMVLHE
jgi:hypothetical protein